VDADRDLGVAADARVVAQRVRKRAARRRVGIAVDQSRTGAGARRGARRPERVADEPYLGGDQNTEQECRDDGDELSRRLSSVVLRSRGGHEAKLEIRAAREARSA
jgi:hypothetical protein